MNLYAFIDWLLVLPEALETAYLEDIEQLEEETKMRYVTSAERIGIRKGIELGRQESQRELLEHLLVARFGPLPGSLAVRVAGAESAQLSAWFERALTADSLDAVFAAA
ncbi:transposase [Candidatus Thiodictyon syntrophicum]|uniref:transposase n=1 Tax=Candidatus Thiodictyon syntrophicum TaxID=1166950 RepID=UPI0015626049|nr:transposase [Candidatus Thiodictyon syntrophicum]